MTFANPDIDLEALLKDEDFGDKIRSARERGMSDEKIQSALKQSKAFKLKKPFTAVAGLKDKSWLSQAGTLIGEGFEQSATAILTGQGPDAKRMRELALKDYNWFQKTVLGTSAVISDLPVFFTGEVAGTAATGNPIAGTAVAFALPAAIRETWNAYTEFKEENPNSDFTFGEFLGNLDTIAAETGREAVVGVAVGGMGKLMKGLLTKDAFKGVFGSRTIDELGKEFRTLTGVGKAVEAGAEVGTLTAASSAVHGELPTVDALIENALVIGGLKISGKVAKGVLKIAKKSNVNPLDILSGMTQEQVDKLNKSAGFSDGVADIVGERVTEIKGFRKEAAAETAEITAKDRIRRGVEIAKEYKETVRNLNAKEQKTIEATRAMADERVKRINDKMKKKFEKLIPKETEGREELQNKLLAKQVEDSQRAVEAKIRLSEGESKIGDKLSKEKEKLQQESSKEVVKLEKESEAELQGEENRRQNKEKLKLHEERKKIKKDKEILRLKEKARLAKAKSENQEKAIKRQTEQSIERKQKEFNAKEAAREKRIKSQENEPEFKKKKAAIEQKFSERILKEQAKLQERLHQADIKSETAKKKMATELSKDLKKRETQTADAFTKSISKFDKDIQKSVTDIEKSLKTETDKITKQKDKTIEREQQKFEKQRDKAKKNAFKRWQNVKDPTPRGYQDIGKDGNRKQIIRKKYKNQQDYKLVGNNLEFGRPVGENAGVLIEHQQVLEDIAASKTESLEDNMKFHKKVADVFNGTLGKMFVDVPFNSIGAKETGFAIKNYFTKQLSIEDKTVRRFKEVLRPKDYTETELRQLILLAERKTLPKQFEKRFKEAHKEIRAIFDDLGKQLQQQGAFEKLFPFSKISANKATLESLKRQLSGTNDKAGRIKIESEINRIIGDNKALETVRFVSIPAALFWEDLYGKNPMKGSAVLKAMTADKRSSHSITDLLRLGAIKESDVNFDDIMSNYVKRAARDIALFDIINSAKKDGLVASHAKDGMFVPLSAVKYPLLANQFAHPAFAEFLGNYTHPEPHGFIQRMLQMAKGFAFFNPMVLPIYDLYQGAMLGAISPFHPIKTVKTFMRAMKSMRTQDEMFQQAEANATFSSPMDKTFEDFKGEMIKARTYFGNGAKAPFAEFISDFLSPSSMKTLGVKALYDTSQKIAWLGDRYVRMASYIHLIDQGLSPRDAGQVAALFHGDYAAVSPKLRKKLNLLFFTPTFKLAMGRLYGDMLTSAVKAPFVKKSQSAYQNKITNIKAMGLINTAGILFGTNMLMNSLGYETQQFGRKYFMKVDTDEGEKELTTVFSNPTNIALKFFYRGAEALDPLNTNSLEAFYNLVQWEVHPVWRTALQIRDNKSFVGDPIYSELGDTSIIKFAKAAKYSINQLLPAVTKAEEVFEPQQGKQTSTQAAGGALGKDFGTMGQFLFQFFGFNYLRQPGVQRDAYRIKQILSKFKSDMRHGRLTKKQITVAQERLDKILKKHRALQQVP